MYNASAMQAFNKTFYSLLCASLCLNLALPSGLQALAPVSMLQESAFETQLKRLMKMVSLNDPQEMQRLGFELGIVLQIHEIIIWCLQEGRSEAEFQITTDATLNNVPGFKSEMRKEIIQKAMDNKALFFDKSIVFKTLAKCLAGMEAPLIEHCMQQCFNRMDFFCKFGVEAIKAGKADGPTVRRWIKQVMDEDSQNGIYIAKSLAEAAVDRNISGWSADDVNDWVNKLFSKNAEDAVGMIMAAIKNKISGVDKNRVATWLQQCCNHRRFEDAVRIIRETITNHTPGVTAAVLEEWIQTMSEDVWSEQDFTMLALAIENDLEGLDRAIVDRWVRKCCGQGHFSLAARMTAQAIHKKVPGINGETIEEWRQVFYDKSLLAESLNIVLAAIRNKIAGVDADMVERWIARFRKDPYAAGQILIEAKRQRIVNVRGDRIKNVIRRCYERQSPYWAGLLALEEGIRTMEIGGKKIDLIDQAIQESVRSADWHDFVLTVIRNEGLKVNAKDVDAWINSRFNQGLAYEVEKIAIAAIKRPVEEIDASMVMAWDNAMRQSIHSAMWGAGLRMTKATLTYHIDGTEEMLEQYIKEACYYGYSENVSELATEAIVHRRVTGKAIQKWIEACLNHGWAELASKIGVLAIEHHIEDISDDMINGWLDRIPKFPIDLHARRLAIALIKTRPSKNAYAVIEHEIQKRFFRDNPRQAAGIALDAFQTVKYPRKLARVWNLLNGSDFLGKENVRFAAGITSLALKEGKASDLWPIFMSLHDHENMLPMIKLIGDIVGKDQVLLEVLKSKGVQGYVPLYETIFPHRYDDTLPNNLDFENPVTIGLLDHITHFSKSTFTRSDLTWKDIYEDYLKDSRAGRIKPLPPNLPSPRIMEVATTKHQGFTQEARGYYQEMIASLRQATDALDAKVDDGLLLQDIQGRIDSAIAELQSKMPKKGDMEKAHAQKQSQIRVLREARSMLAEPFLKNGFPLENLNEDQLAAIRNLQGGEQAIRTILFKHALAQNDVWQKYFRDAKSWNLTQHGVRQFIAFVQSFIKPHVLDGLEAGIRREILLSINLKVFQDELDRMGEIRDFRRKIRITPSRGWLAEFVGYFSDECWTSTRDILKDNPDAIVLIFEDVETQEILGGTLLMPNSVKKKKVLIDRGLSPRTELTAVLNMENFMEQIACYEEDIARVLGAKAILVPIRDLQLGLGTNNPDVIQYYERTLGEKKPVKLDIRNDFNGHDITNGCLVVFRTVPRKSRAVLEPDFRTDNILGAAV